MLKEDRVGPGDEPLGCDVLSPASRQIRGELVRLRGRAGASTSKLRTHCPNLQRLSATTDELVRAQLHPDDRHVAAFAVVRCAATNLPRTDLSVIARSTLNLANEDGGLDQRRQRLRGALHLSPKEYVRLEQLAYDELADRLVETKRSPCTDTVDVKVVDEITINLTIPGAQLVRILQLLAVEDRHALRDRLYEVLLDALPLSGKHAPSGPTALWGSTLLSVVLREAWPPRSHLPTLQSQVLEAEALDSMLNSSEPWQQRHSNALVSMRKETESVVVSAKAYEEFHFSLLILAAYLEALEIDDRWGELISHATQLADR